MSQLQQLIEVTSKFRTCATHFPDGKKYLEVCASEEGNTDTLLFEFDEDGTLVAIK